jgi:hypothetical protein
MQLLIVIGPFANPIKAQSSSSINHVYLFEVISRAVIHLVLYPLAY